MNIKELIKKSRILYRTNNEARSVIHEGFVDDFSPSFEYIKLISTIDHHIDGQWFKVDKVEIIEVLNKHSSSSSCY